MGRAIPFRGLGCVLMCTSPYKGQDRLGWVRVSLKCRGYTRESRLAHASISQEQAREESKFAFETVQG